MNEQQGVSSANLADLEDEDDEDDIVEEEIEDEFDDL